VSRIQDILAKAERDGTTRRTSTQAGPSLAPSPVATTIAPAIDGSSALDPLPFVPAGMTAASAMAPAASLAQPAAPAVADVRTAHATLHPALVAAIAPQSAVAEQYRAIRARLTHREEMGPLRTILVTSPAARDGKSVTAANLALTMAQEFQRNVLLIDGDLRGSSVHSLFGIDRGPGLSDVLSGQASLDEALVYLPDYRLTVLTAGSTPHFPTELLGSTTMRRALDTLRARFDRILLDLPAVAPLADVGTVSPLVDGVLMVVRAGVTQRPALDEALAGFDSNKVLGVVLNDTK
jgi:capsular exopolysaccharide synthesis family protein